MITLMKQQWKSSWFNTLVWSLILSLLSFIMVLSFPPFQKQGQQLTQALQNISFLKNLKDITEMSTLNGFINGQWLLFLPFILSFFAVLYINQIFTREIDTRSIEFTLSLPISRVQLVLSRFIIFIFQVFIIHFAIWVGLWLGKIVIHKPGSLLAYFEILCNDAILIVGLGALALFISLFFSDYTKSLMINIGLMILLYFENMIGKAINLSYQQWNILYWYKNDDMIQTHHFVYKSALVEICFILFFLLMSFWSVQKKDL